MDCVFSLPFIYGKIALLPLCTHSLTHAMSKNCSCCFHFGSFCTCTILAEALRLLRQLLFVLFIVCPLRGSVVHQNQYWSSQYNHTQNGSSCWVHERFSVCLSPFLVRVWPFGALQRKRINQYGCFCKKLPIHLLVQENINVIVPRRSFGLVLNAKVLQQHCQVLTSC